MNKDVQRLREPGAWVLLGAVALQILSGLIGLLFGRGRLPFTMQAFQYVTADEFFTGVADVGLVVLAVLLVIRLGGPPTRGARNVVLGALVVLGVIALLDIICMLAGLGAGAGDTGVLLDNATTAKITMFVYGVAKLAVLGVGGYYVLTVLQSLAPVAGPYGAPYGQQPWGQPGAQQPYGQPGYGPPPQAPPAYGQQPPPQQYPPQGYMQAPYGQPGQPGQPGQQGQPGQPAQPYPGYGPPQPGARPPQPPSAPQGAPPPSAPPPASPPPPAPPSSAPPSSAPGDEEEGDWTRAYGTGESASPEPSDTPEGSSPDGSSSERSSSGDAYRPPE